MVTILAGGMWSDFSPFSSITYDGQQLSTHPVVCAASLFFVASGVVETTVSSLAQELHPESHSEAATGVVANGVVAWAWFAGVMGVFGEVSMYGRIAPTTMRTMPILPVMMIHFLECLR